MDRAGGKEKRVYEENEEEESYIGRAAGSRKITQFRKEIRRTDALLVAEG